MGMYINDNKLVTIIVPKTICFDLSKKIDNSLKHEINFIVKRSEFLGEHKIKSEIA